MSTPASDGPTPEGQGTTGDPTGPLAGLRVVEAATLAAGPMVATALGEFGAEVIKVEQPGDGDPMRTWGNRTDGIGLVVEERRAATSAASRSTCASPRARSCSTELLDVSDVLVVGNRPERARAVGRSTTSHGPRPPPALVMLHITGYGRGGPKSDRPGYGTLAEAMSGFAHVVGQPDGPPTLPPFMLADGVAVAWPRRTR